MTERYEITSQLGEDILGSVYLADDTMLHRRVMCRHIEHGDHPDVKDRDESWRKGFAAHTGKLGAMQHPNMMTIYDVNVDDSGAFVFSQLIEGDSLADRLENGALSQGGVYRMAADMLEALHAAHESGVFHGALHTGSIKRIDKASGGHRYLLVDLGLNQLATMVKAEKVQVADPVLMAPELHEVDRDPDAKADLFMLGQLCYTALVGGHPFSDKSSKECLEAYQGEGMPGIDEYLDGLNPEFVKWVMRMIEVNPENRPADTAEAMVSLYAIELDEPEPNVPGQTYAVPESAANISAAAQLVTASQSVTENTNTAAESHLEMTQAQVVNGIAESAKKEKAMMTYVIGGLVLLLVIGGIIAATRDSGGDSAEDVEENIAENIAESESVPLPIMSIGEKELASGQQNFNKPVKISLDSSSTVDWLIGAGVPIASKFQTDDGGYDLSVKTFGVPVQLRMTHSPIRFTMGDKILAPQSSFYRNKKMSDDAGYEIQLSIPENDPSSITANLYLVQKGGGYRIEVIHGEDKSTESRQISATKPGVIRVPVVIENPVAGGLYTIRVLSSPVLGEKSLQSGLCGLVIDQH